MLSSWKEIAHFFGKGVRTVQRWEKTLDLPIHRPPGAPSNVVLARTSDLEEWMHRGAGSRSEETVVSSTDSIISAIATLEVETSELARLSGVSAPMADGAATAEERIAALTDIVGQANARLAARSGVHRVA